MKRPLPKGNPHDWTMPQLEDFGRIRLSDHFFMRDMLYSEVASVHGLRNVPDNPALAVEVGRHLCTTLLEPLHATFGHVSIRSALPPGGERWAVWLNLRHRDVLAIYGPALARCAGAFTVALDPARGLPCAVPFDAGQLVTVRETADS